MLQRQLGQLNLKYDALFQQEGGPRHFALRVKTVVPNFFAPVAHLEQNAVLDYRP